MSRRPVATGESGPAAGGPAGQFIQAINASISYWQERTRDLGDDDLGRLDKERRNLYRAVQFGLARAETWEATAEIVLGAMPLAERRIYWGEWIALLEGLVDQFPAENPELGYHLNLELGRLYREKRQLEAAAEVHKSSLALAEGLGKNALLAKAHYNLGRDYHEMRKYSLSEEQARIILSLLEKEEGEGGWLVAEAEKLLGLAAESRGEIEEALARMERAVEAWRALYRPTGKRTELARALNDLGNTLRAAGRQDEAIERYEEAASLLASTANELDKINIQLNLAVMYFDKAEWTRAEAILREADSHWLRQSEHLKHQGYIAGNLGNILIKQERWVEAERSLRRAVALWEQLQDDLMLALYTGTLGEALAPQGQREAAERCFDRALLLLEKYPDNAFAGRIRKAFLEEKEKVQINKS